MRNILGPPVHREDFLDRKQETDRIWWLAERGNILMLGPRRVGKTSVLHHLADRPRAGWRCLFLTVESATTEEEFVARLLAKILELEPQGVSRMRLSQGLRKLLGSLDKVDAGPLTVDVTRMIGQHWRDIGNDIFISIARLEGNILLMIDEFPIFVNNLLMEARGRERARQFMNWFREARTAPSLRNASVRFILTGSIGLDAIVKQLGMSSTINDLEVFPLRPLTRELADELLRRLSEGEDIPISAELRARLLARISWLIPFHVQLLFRQIVLKIKFHKRELSTALLDEAYQDLLSREEKPHFEHWAERLDHPMAIPEERDLTRAILRAAALDPDGVSMDTVRQLRTELASSVSESATLLSLERDGYLIQAGDRWSFASSLLRDWWRKWMLKER